MYPVANMPMVFRWVAEFNPIRHYLVIVRGIFLKGAGMDVLWPQIGVLAVMGTVVVMVAAISAARLSSSEVVTPSYSPSITRMATFTAISTLLWNALIVAVALAFQHNWAAIYEFARLYNGVVFLLLAVLAAGWGAYRWWLHRLPDKYPL